MEKGTPAKGVFEKWDKQAIQEITDPSAQPASSLHPQHQGAPGQRPSIGRGIFLKVSASAFCRPKGNPYPFIFSRASAARTRTSPLSSFNA